MTPSTTGSDTLLFISHLLAAALGHWLWSHKTQVAATASSVVADGAEILIHQLEWFMTAKPAGVKLHIQVAQILSILSMKYINILQNIFSMLPTLELLEILVISIAIALPIIGLGTPKFRRYGARLYYIITSPITLAYTIMTWIYRWHLNATMHTWLAMRGKTPLVPHTSSSAAASAAASAPPPPQALSPTQLAVASLLFMPCVLTLPTTAWYYSFWSLVEFVLYGLPLTAARAAHGVSFFPLKSGEYEESIGASAMRDILNVLQKWVQGHVFTLN